jgi:poly-gamma-glutamate synthesis protein (capsule biosynthesis protein)
MSCGEMSHRFPVKEYGFKGPVSLVAVGDLMMGGSALAVIQREGANYPFEFTRNTIRVTDISVANLEAPFTRSGKPFQKKFTFRVPPELAGGLVYAGFDVVFLANNHIMDYGPEGFESTVTILDSLGIAHCGAGNDVETAHEGVVVLRNNLSVGFLAYSMTYPEEFWAKGASGGTAYPYMSRLKENIQYLKRNTDIVVVSFHWGEELCVFPKYYQRYYAHQAIDVGADLILGHHPHVLQGIELYKGRLIAYSLGNFVFGSYSRNARESIMLKLIFDQKGPLLAEVIPIIVYNYQIHFQPRILIGDSKMRVLQNLNDISRNLNNGYSIISETGLVTMK